MAKQGIMSDLMTRLSDAETQTVTTMSELMAVRKEYGDGSGRIGAAVDHMIEAYRLLAAEYADAKASK